MIMQFNMLLKEQRFQKKEYNENVFKPFLNNIELTRFKNDTNHQNIYNMLIWHSDGYIHEQKQRKGSIC